ncbi:hypothetical protein BYT27DRAFT_6544560, partial [Phlegmacium glaucopus]
STIVKSWNLLNIEKIVWRSVKSSPSLPQLDFETPDTVSMKAWFITESIKTIGSRKLADMCQPEHTLIPGFTEYWRDFAPFVLELLQACFPPPLQPSWSQPSDTQ